MISFCIAAFPGSPSGYPKGRSTANARGGCTFSVTSRSSVMDTVGMPDFSMTLWTSPTDWWHIGQTGVNKTTSTASSASLRTISGALMLMSLAGAVMEPIRLK
jgi:hypothetical protein